MATANKTTEFLVNLLLPALTAVGKMQLIEIFGKIEEHNSKEVFEHTLRSIYSSFTLVYELAKKTKTKIDDGFVKAILDAVKEVADAKGLVLY